MTTAKSLGENIKNGYIFRIGNFLKFPNMASRLVILVCFVTTSFIVNAQAPLPPRASMLPDVNYAELDKMIAAAKENYPRVKAFEHRVYAATNNVKKTRLGWFDLFTFSFLYSPNNSTAMTSLVNPSILNGYQLGVFFNLGSLLQKPFLVKQAKEELNVSQYERDEYYLNLATMVRERYFIYIQQVAILKLREQSELDAETNMEMTKHKFEKGEMTLDDYNKALGTLSDHTQSKIEGEGALLVAKSSLEELVGKKLEDIK